MDYGRIVSRSFEIAWQHKWLWIFGMFASGAGFNMKIEYLFGLTPKNPLDIFWIFQVDQKMLSEINMGLYPWSFVIGLMVILTTGAIIDSINRIERGGKYSFSTAFSAGVDNFFKLLGLAIILVIFLIAYIIMVSLFLGIIFALNMVLGFLSALIVFFVSILVFLSSIQMISVAYRAIILRNSGMFDALNESYILLKTNFGKNIAAFFIMFAFGIAFTIFTLIIWWILNYPINAVIQALNLTSFPAMLTAMILGLPISFLTAGYYGVFTVSFMTLFYIELVEPKPESAYFPQPPEVDFDQ